MGRTDFFRNVSIAVSGDFGPTRTYDQIKGWVTNVQGTTTKGIIDDTTHLLLSERNWRGQVSAVTQAIQQKSIKIVSFDWLDDALKKKRKIATKPYEWPNLDKETAKRVRQKMKVQDKAEKSKTRRQRSTLLSEFQDHVGIFDAPQEARSPDEDSLEGDSPDEDAPKGKASGKAKAKKAAIGAKKVLFTDTHHAYVDATGFKHSVVLFKVESSLNLNARVVIMLWETNSYPKKYTVDVKTEGATAVPTTLRITDGSNFSTAMREFKEQFETNTKVIWDKRQLCFPMRKPGSYKEPTIDASGFVTEAQIVAAGGAQDPRKGKANKDKMKDFEVQAYLYKNPPIGEPQGLVPSEYEYSQLSMEEGILLSAEPQHELEAGIQENAHSIVEANGEATAGAEPADVTTSLEPLIHSHEASAAGATGTNPEDLTMSSTHETTPALPVEAFVFTAPGLETAATVPEEDTTTMVPDTEMIDVGTSVEDRPVDGNYNISSTPAVLSPGHTDGMNGVEDLAMADIESVEIKEENASDFVFGSWTVDLRSTAPSGRGSMGPSRNISRAWSIARDKVLAPATGDRAVVESAPTATCDRTVSEPVVGVKPSSQFAESIYDIQCAKRAIMALDHEQGHGAQTQ